MIAPPKPRPAQAEYFSMGIVDSCPTCVGHLASGFQGNNFYMPHSGALRCDAGCGWLVASRYASKRNRGLLAQEGLVTGIRGTSLPECSRCGRADSWAFYDSVARRIDLRCLAFDPAEGTACGGKGDASVDADTKGANPWKTPGAARPHETKGLVLSALADADRPLAADEVAAIAGLSYVKAKACLRRASSGLMPTVELADRRWRPPGRFYRRYTLTSAGSIWVQWWDREITE